MEKTTKFEDVSPIKIQVIFQPAIVSLLEGMTYHLPFGGGPQHLGPHKSPWFGGDTNDGSEIQRSPVDMVVYAYGRVNDPMAKLQFLRVGWGGVGWGGDDDIL